MVISRPGIPRPAIASPIPFGLGEKKPHHYRDMLRVLWDNRDNLAYAARILQHGVCDGCSLGPAGLHAERVRPGSLQVLLARSQQPA